MGLLLAVLNFILSLLLLVEIHNSDILNLKLFFLTSASLLFLVPILVICRVEILVLEGRVSFRVAADVPLVLHCNSASKGS